MLIQCHTAAACMFSHAVFTAPAGRITRSAHAQPGTRPQQLLCVSPHPCLPRTAAGVVLGLALLLLARLLLLLPGACAQHKQAQSGAFQVVLGKPLRLVSSQSDDVTQHPILVALVLWLVAASVAMTGFGST